MDSKVDSMMDSTGSRLVTTEQQRRRGDSGEQRITERVR
jgi:hypothetical protein